MGEAERWRCLCRYEFTVDFRWQWHWTEAVLGSSPAGRVFLPSRRNAPGEMTRWPTAIFYGAAMSGGGRLRQLAVLLRCHIQSVAADRGKKKWQCKVVMALR